jgi:hypothetical protein
MAVRSHKYSITTHRYRGGCSSIIRIVEACVVVATGYDLERVAVEMEGVFSRVVIVEDDFYDFVLCEDEGVCVAAVDGGVGCVGAGGEDGVEGGDFGADVGYIVEEGAGFELVRGL